MDTMKLRGEGVPEHPWLMKLVMVIMRLCAAAYLVDDPTELFLGRKGRWLKRLVQLSHTKRLILWLFINGSDRVIGIGGQSIVMRSRDGEHVEKYSYTLAGADPLVLERTRNMSARQQRQIEQQFGDLVQPTQFDIAELPLRGLLGKLRTLRSCQERLHNTVDIFSTSAIEMFARPHSRAQRDITILATRTRAWIKSNKWLDIIGPKNIVLTTDFGAARVRIIDTTPYAADYLRATNPVVGRPYRAVFHERLKIIESYSSRLAVLVVAIGAWVILQHTARMMPGFADAIEDALEHLAA